MTSPSTARGTPRSLFQKVPDPIDLSFLIKKRDEKKNSGKTQGVHLGIKARGVT